MWFLVFGFWFLRSRRQRIAQITNCHRAHACRYERRRKYNQHHNAQQELDKVVRVMRKMVERQSVGRNCRSKTKHTNHRQELCVLRRVFRDQGTKDGSYNRYEDRANPNRNIIRPISCHILVWPAVYFTSRRKAPAI